MKQEMEELAQQIEDNRLKIQRGNIENEMLEQKEFQLTEEVELQK